MFAGWAPYLVSGQWEEPFQIIIQKTSYICAWNPITQDSAWTVDANAGTWIVQESYEYPQKQCLVCALRESWGYDRVEDWKLLK